MKQQTKKQLKAVGKIALGAVKMASGVATTLGHGLLGGYLRAHSQPWVRYRLGKIGLQSGLDMFNDGLKELNG